MGRTFQSVKLSPDAQKQPIGPAQLDRVRVKGKDEPVAIFAAIGRDGEVAKERLEELKLWGQALRLYRARNWDQRN